MQIDIKHIAKLSRLKIDENEAASYEKEMTNMISMVERIPDVLSGAMGNQMYVANFGTKEEMDEFYTSVLACHE